MDDLSDADDADDTADLDLDLKNNNDTADDTTTNDTDQYETAEDSDTNDDSPGKVYGTCCAECNGLLCMLPEGTSCLYPSCQLW
jgi:hypothetical protein